MDDEKFMKKKLILLSVFSALSACTSTVSGSDVNCQKDGSISALYITIQDNKELYKVLDTTSKNAVSDQVYASLLNTITYIDSLTHLYDIGWAKSSSNPDDYLKPSTIDALCVGNIFLKNYHNFGSEKYKLIDRYEDMYKLSMSYQPLYKKVLEENQHIAKKAGMESIDSFDCLALMVE